MKKILIVSGHFFACGGVTTVIMNHYDELINQGYHVDMLQLENRSSKYIEKIESNGGHFYTFDTSLSRRKQLKNALSFFKVHHYDLVHMNHVDQKATMILLGAKLHGVPHIVYHSHNPKLRGSIKRNLMSFVYDNLCISLSNHYAACSKSAGVSIFRDKLFTIIPNAIDCSIFKFNKDNRHSIRKELGIKDEDLVVGTVCRINDQKNPLYMIKVFSEILKKRPNSWFLWLGEYPKISAQLYEQVVQLANDLKVDKRLLLVGSKNDPNRWYSAMDVFFMPSKFEGLGITYIEAQANGLPTYASDVVPVETNVSGYIKYLPITVAPSVWADEILKCPIRNNIIESDYQSIINKGYDLSTGKYDFCKLYDKIFNEYENCN